MIIINLLLGFISIYYSSKDKLYLYIIILFFVLIIKIIFVILLFNIVKDIKNILLIIIIFIIQIVIILLNFISSLFERNELIKELEESPLNYVDETINEDMYKSILSQCLNPEDKTLKKEFKKKLKKRKKEMLKMSLGSSLNNNNQ